MRILIMLIMLCGGAVIASPQECNDAQTEACATDIEVSLLTCEPGEQPYAHYGHTAMRVREPSRGTDVVYNYGCFDFSAPNFVLRFTLGQTDYFLGVCTFRQFEWEYLSQGRRVWQQKLNISQTEACAIKAYLEEKALPENRVYRYNFLYNNCTTKCRDIIETLCDGAISWRTDYDEMSLRDVMHQYNQHHFWARQGIDLCLGSRLDRTATPREKMFSPMYLMWSAEGAHVDGRRLFGSTELVVNPSVIYEAPTSDATSIVCIIIGLVLIVTRALVAKGYVRTHYGFRGHRASMVRIGMDVVMWCIIGIAGIIPVVLICCSEHPTTSSNLLVLAINPLPLIALVLLRWQRTIWLLRLMLLMSVVAIVLCLLDVQSAPEVAWICIIYMITSLADRIKPRKRVLRE